MDSPPAADSLLLISDLDPSVTETYEFAFFTKSHILHSLFSDLGVILATTTATPRPAWT